jgi:hypothetical protein
VVSVTDPYGRILGFLDRQTLRASNTNAYSFTDIKMSAISSVQINMTLIFIVSYSKAIQIF